MPRGGTLDFNWQGWPQGVLGFKISGSGIFLDGKIWQVFLWVTWLSKGSFGCVFVSCRLIEIRHGIFGVVLLQALQILGGFNFCPHLIIPVTWNPEYPPPPLPSWDYDIFLFWWWLIVYSLTKVTSGFASGDNFFYNKEGKYFSFECLRAGKVHCTLGSYFLAATQENHYGELCSFMSKCQLPMTNIIVKETFILGLQPRDKRAMLVSIQKTLLHRIGYENGV